MRSFYPLLRIGNRLPPFYIAFGDVWAMLRKTFFVKQSFLVSLLCKTSLKRYEAMHCLTSRTYCLTSRTYNCYDKVKSPLRDKNIAFGDVTLLEGYAILEKVM